MIALGVTVFVASLAGSPHCAAMCGGLVAFSAGAGASVWTHHLGRGLVYGLMGAAAGALGHGVNVVGGQTEVATLVATALMIAWATVALLEAWGVTQGHTIVPRSLQRLAIRASFRARALPPGLRGLAMGAASSLIPCGWLYAFVITAAGTGSPLAGLGAMLAFWLGTLPMLISVGALARRLAGQARASLPRWSPVLVLGVGLLSLALRWPSSTVDDPTSRSEPICHGRGR